MTRSSLLRLPLVLALVAAPVTVAVLAPTPAFAQSTSRSSSARVMKATDVDVAAQLSAELRAKAHEARLASIEQLKSIIKETSADASPETKAEMLLRLSDLYFEEGRDLYLEEMRVCQEEQEKCFNTPGCNPEAVVCNNAGSKEWQDKSIKLYRQILANYPQFQRADEATFYLGQALNDTGLADDANAEFTRLVKVYPDSKFVPDAYVLIGEYWFERNQAFKALNAYQKAATYKEHEKYAFAMYKLAWCQYNIQEYDKAIDTMKAVVSYAPQEGTTSRRNIQLQEEALKDLVRFFADAGDMDEAIAYFTKLGKKDMIRDLLKRLASTYVEQGKFENAVQMYRRLISENPQDPGAPDFQNEIIQAYTKMGRKEDTIAEIDRLLRTYGKTSSWAKANASNQEAVKGASEMIEKNLRTVATNYHNEAKKIGSGAQAAQTYALAEKAYTTYLEEFPDSKYSYDVRYAFGELLYKIKKYDQAYDQYMKVVATDPKGQHSQFCAESAIFAADEMIKREKAAGTSGGPDPGKRTEPVPLTDWEKKSLAALDQYARLYPDSPKTRNIIYKSAYLLYNKNQFKEASERFNVVIKMDPKSREAEQAANLILDSFALVEDWENLKANAKFYYDQEGLGSGDFKREVFGIYENASLKLIEVSFKKNPDKAKAAEDYWAFYKEFPTSANADLALNNASVYLHDLGKTARAIEVRKELIAKFPKSKFYKDQVAALGFDYESMANFAEAANWYEKLYALDKAHPAAADAIFSAALFRNAMGQWEQGIKNYQQYMTSYPDKPNLDGLQLEIGKIYEDHQRWPEASKVYLAFFQKPPTNATIDEVMFARLRYGLLMDRLGQGAGATKHWKESIDWFNKNKAGKSFEFAGEYVAQMLYILAEPEFQAFASLKLSGPDRKVSQKQEDKILTQQLVEKTKALQGVEQTYTAILATGAGEWGLASLVKLGQAYENMAESLLNAAAPSYLTEDQKEIYQSEISTRAFPLQERAIAAYSQGLEKAYELNLYNENTAFATRRLGELRPTEFQPVYEIVPKASFSAPSVYSASFETEP